MTIRAEQDVEVVGTYEFEMKIFSFEHNEYIGLGPHQLVAHFGGIVVEVLEPLSVIDEPDPDPEEESPDDEDPVRIPNNSSESLTFEEVYEQLVA